ncbi:MAG: hypothetical protein GY708_15205 [Actinomycetia bacterium]|nr:hypothetical protein [Actinomycetes bacterium]MCP4958073.1 hypothetical protein [Actinomycetes bacterium]
MRLAHKLFRTGGRTESEIAVDRLGLGDEVSVMGPDRALRRFRLQSVRRRPEAVERCFVEIDADGMVAVGVQASTTDGGTVDLLAAPALRVWTYTGFAAESRFASRSEVVAMDGVETVPLSDWLGKECGLVDWSEQVANTSHIYASVMPDEFYYEHLRSALAARFV